jgi:hypothetical protein
MNAEYFLLSQDRRYTLTPRIIGLSYVLDRRDVSPGNMHRLPKRVIVKAESQKEYDCPDVLDAGLFLVSDGVMDVFLLYDKRLPYRPAVLLCGETVQMKYNLPVFGEAECLHGDSERNVYNRTVVKKIVLARDALGNRSVFRIAGTYYRHIVIRLDVAESLLRRKTRGIALYGLETR